MYALCMLYGCIWKEKESKMSLLKSLLDKITILYYDEYGEPVRMSKKDWLEGFWIVLFFIEFFFIVAILPF